MAAQPPAAARSVARLTPIPAGARTAVVVLALGGVSACGATAAASPTPLTARQAVTVRLRGEITGGTTYRAFTPGSTCEQVATSGEAASGGTAVGVPTPPEETLVLGHPLNLIVVPTTYTGPGRYTSADFNTENAVMVDAHSWTPVPGTPPPQTTVVFNADGAGSFTFTDWRDAATGATESGTFIWTCSD